MGIIDERNSSMQCVAGGTCTCGQMYLSQVQSVPADPWGHFVGTVGQGEKTL